MKNSIIVSITFLLLISCGIGRTNEEVIIDGKYKMKVPTNMSETFDLNDEASLQYENMFKEIYLIVIDEDLAEFKTSIEEYELADSYTQDFFGRSQLMIDIFAMDVEIFNESKPIEIRIDGSPALQYELEGRIEGYDIYYCYTFVEGKKNFYQILSWTLLDKKEEHVNVLKKMPLSFEEL